MYNVVNGYIKGNHSAISPDINIVVSVIALWLHYV